MTMAFGGSRVLRRSLLVTLVASKQTTYDGVVRQVAGERTSLMLLHVTLLLVLVLKTILSAY